MRQRHSEFVLMTKPSVNFLPSRPQPNARGERRPFPPRDPSREESENKFALLLRQCIKWRDLDEGRRIHQQIVESDLEGSRYLGNLLVHMYGKCGSVQDAREAFGKIQFQNVYSWNMMTVALLENGKLTEAAEFIQRRPEHSVVSSNAMIAAYAQNGHLREAKAHFDTMTEKDVVTWNSMITAYSQNSHLYQAKAVFDQMKERDVVSWNSMVAAFAQARRGKEAVQTFRNMEMEGMQPDFITVMCVLNACAESRLVTELRRLHWRALEFIGETKVGNAVVDMYGKCGDVQGAKLVFDSLATQDVVTWTTMLSAYAQNGDLMRARALFDKMPQKTNISWNCMLMAYSQTGKLAHVLETFNMMLLEDDRDVKPDEGSLVTVLDACANAGALREGVTVHEVAKRTGLQSDLKISNALLSVYTKCNQMEIAREVFENMVSRNVITWTTMISAYAQNGHGREALKMFRRMDLEGIPANEVTYVSALDACTCVSALAEGRLLHQRSIETGYFAADPKVGNAVINIYGKCGKTEEARLVFESMPETNRISWNGVIAAYAQNGHCSESLELLKEMLLHGVDPDQITFTIVLSICAHAGLRRECWSQFISVQADHRVAHDVSHYVCIVDLLGRVGDLDEAEELVLWMPFEPTVILWTTLLAACRTHKSTSRAVNAAEQAIALDPEDSGLFVLLANVYLDVGKVAEAEKVKQRLAERIRRKVTSPS